MTTTATVDGAQLVPEDLCPAAVKLARRVQALEKNRTYVIILTRLPDRIIATLVEHGKAEVMK
jgi:hypothetical protein